MVMTLMLVVRASIFFQTDADPVELFLRLGCIIVLYNVVVDLEAEGEFNH